MTDPELKVQLVAISQIDVLNPRARGQHKFKQIVSSIQSVGLKKPIRICPHDSNDAQQRYYLVYGQGRLESYVALGQTHIPAVIVQLDKKDILLQSLIENLARKRYRSLELAKQLPLLKERGYSVEEIARKTCLSTDYVRGVLRLLSKGETHLLRAVEAGQIPITVATTIATSDDASVQRALAEAYENKSLRGKELMRARKLIEYRRTHGPNGIQGRRRSGSISADQVAKTLVREMNKQSQVIRKAKLAETRLTFLTAGLKQLFADEHFVTLLRAEKLDTLPTFLHEQIQGKK